MKEKQNKEINFVANSILDISINLLDIDIGTSLVFAQKRFFNRETISFIRISQLAESPPTLSWFAEILELRKG